MRQVSGNTLQQVEKFRYQAVVFTSYGRHECQDVDIRISKAYAVLRELYRSVDETGAFKHSKAVRF